MLYDTNRLLIVMATGYVVIFGVFGLSVVAGWWNEPTLAAVSERPLTVAPPALPHTEPLTDMPALQSAVTSLDCEPVISTDQTSLIVVGFTNSYRFSIGATLLRWSPALFRSARDHALAIIQYPACLQKDGQPETCSGTVYAQNSATQLDPRQAVETWIDAPTTEALMTEPQWLYSGVAIVNCGELALYVQHFAETKTE